VGKVVSGPTYNRRGEKGRETMFVRDVNTGGKTLIDSCFAAFVLDEQGPAYEGSLAITRAGWGIIPPRLTTLYAGVQNSDGLYINWPGKDDKEGLLKETFALVPKRINEDPEEGMHFYFSHQRIVEEMFFSPITLQKYTVLSLNPKPKTPESEQPRQEQYAPN